MPHCYTTGQIAWLRDMYPRTPIAELTAAFNAKFGASVNAKALHTAMQRHGIRSGRSGHFAKGNVPHNKGRHYDPGGRTAETRFKPGHRPARWRPVGSERVVKHDYIEVKVAEPGKWEPKHRAVWRQTHGDIPKGCAVIFADGDKRNFAPDNLMLVSRAQLAVMNKLRLTGGSRALTEAGKLLADVKMAITKRARE